MGQIIVPERYRTIFGKPPIMAGETADLLKLLPDLTEFALTPYLEPKKVQRLVKELNR